MTYDKEMTMCWQVYSGSHSILNNTYSFDDSLTITNPTAGDAKISTKKVKN